MPDLCSQARLFFAGAAYAFGTTGLRAWAKIIAVMGTTPINPQFWNAALSGNLAIGSTMLRAVCLKQLHSA